MYLELQCTNTNYCNQLWKDTLDSPSRHMHRCNNASFALPIAYLAMPVDIITSLKLVASPMCHMQHHDLADNLSWIKWCRTLSLEINQALYSDYGNQCKYLNIPCHHLVEGAQYLSCKVKWMLEHHASLTHANIMASSTSTCISMWTCSMLETIRKLGMIILQWNWEQWLLGRPNSLGWLKSWERLQKNQGNVLPFMLDRMSWI